MQRWNDVGEPADEAVPSGQQVRHEVLVEAGEHGEVGQLRLDGRDDLAGVADVVHRVLDAPNAVEVAPQAQHQLGAEVHRGAIGEVVEQDRQLDASGHLGEVAVEALLVELEVVRRDHHGGVGTGLLGMSRQLDDFLHDRPARPDQHGGPSPHSLDGEAGELLLLGRRQREELARAAEEEDPVDAAGDQVLDDPLVAFEVQAAFGVEGGHHGRKHSTQHHSSPLSISRLSRAPRQTTEDSGICAPGWPAPPTSPARTCSPLLFR